MSVSAAGSGNRAGSARDGPRTQREIATLARELLAASPDPAPRVCLLRDVLGRRDDDPALRAARRALEGSRHVERLRAHQRGDGSFGRFHSRDTRDPQSAAVPTTEWAVERALALGLGRGHPLLRGAAGHAARILREAAPFPDPPERNARWPLGVRLFAAGTLARIDPGAAALRPERERWAGVAHETLRRGRLDPEAESRAVRRRTGLATELRYLRLTSRYAVALLAASPDLLSGREQRTLVAGLLEQPAGIGYLGVPLARRPDASDGRVLDGWLASLELLSRIPAWREPARPALAHLRTLLASGRLGDAGRPPASPRLPLSETWRRAGARRTDWTVRACVLLARACER